MFSATFSPENLVILVESVDYLQLKTGSYYNRKFIETRVVSHFFRKVLSCPAKSFLNLSICFCRLKVQISAIAACIQKGSKVLFQTVLDLVTQTCSFF